MIDNLAGGRQIVNPELCITCPLRDGCDAGVVVAQEVSVKYQDVGFQPIDDNTGLYDVDMNNPKILETVSEIHVGPENQQPLSRFKILTKHFLHLEPQFKKCDQPTEVKRGFFTKRVVGVGCTALKNLSVA